MKVKDFERVIFTPGLGRESFNRDYFEVDNTVIIGTTGSGKTTTTHAIVKSILDSNSPCAYSLIYMDMASAGNNPMCNTNRIVSSMAPMEYLSTDYAEMSYRKRAIQMIRHLTLATWWSSISSGEEPDEPRPGKFLIVVIENFDALDRLEQKLVFTMMKTYPFVKFIVNAQKPDAMRDYMDLFTYRIVTRTSTAAESNVVLGCNLGHEKADAYGTVWFYNDNKPNTYRKYSVDMIPVSLLNRFMKVQAGYTGARNPICEDIAATFRNTEMILDFFKKYMGCENDVFRQYIDKFLTDEKEGASNE